MDINFQGTAVILQDTHHPFHDQRIIHEVELFLEELQPGLILYPGDMGDFYPASKFDSNPKRANDLQKDLDMSAGLFERQRAICPNARMIEEDGNHEERLRKYLWSKAQALASLRCLTVEGLYRLKENEVEHVPYGEGILINGNFLVTHGDIVRVHSGYTAKAMGDKHGESGICGHCHRGGNSLKTKRYGIYGWWENFCLCSLKPEYTNNPDWQQGFSVVTFKHGRFWVQPIQVIKGKFIYGDKVWGSGGKKRE